MKLLEKSIICDRILNENLCGEKSAAARKWRKYLETIKSEETAKNTSLFLYF